MKKLILVLILVSCMAAPSYAEKWTQVWKNDNGTTNFIDEDSVENKDNKIYFWGKFVPTGAIKDDMAATYGQGASEYYSYNVIDCKNMKAGYLKVKVLNDKAEIINSDEVKDDKVEYQAIEGESPILAVYKMLCPLDKK